MTTSSLRTFGLITAIGGSALLAAAAQAQDGLYASLSGGMSFQGDSDNEGVFPNGFTTGQGTTIPAGTALPAGTDVGWTTEFDNGFVVSGAIGKKTESGFRAEVELSYDSADVDTHIDVSAAGLDLTAEDAALLTGGADPLGLTVGQVVADGQGDISSLGIFANVYYDLATDSAFTPYVGAGIGYAKTDVDYSPSGVGIIDDDDSGFAWQVMGGAAFAVSDTTEIFGGIRYRSQEADVEASLFPAEFEVENKRVFAEVGVRFSFQ